MPRLTRATLCEMAPAEPPDRPPAPPSLAASARQILPVDSIEPTDYVDSFAPNWFFPEVLWYAYEDPEVEAFVARANERIDKLGWPRLPAPPDCAREIRNFVPIGVMPPERYVALYNHREPLMGPFGYSYEDPEVEAYVARVYELKCDYDGIAALRRQWLTPKEYKRVLREQAEDLEEGDSSLRRLMRRLLASLRR
jgi:hypothetical protein